MSYFNIYAFHCIFLQIHVFCMIHWPRALDFSKFKIIQKLAMLIDKMLGNVITRIIVRILNSNPTHVLVVLDIPTLITEIENLLPAEEDGNISA